MVLFIALVFFIWEYNLKPLQINKEINIAVHWQEQGNCEKALETMEKILPSHSSIDSYLRLKYIDILSKCIKEETETGKKVELTNKAVEILKENIEIQPTYTRNWYFLGVYTNYLISATDQKELKEQADHYFSQAYSLSPKRQEILKDWIKLHLSTKEYKKALKTAQECIAIDPSYGECWWQKGLAQIYLKDVEEAKESLAAAKEQGYNIETKSSLKQLSSAYINTESYPELIEVYQKLIKLEPAGFQHYADLAVCYKMTGDHKAARQAAQKVIELSPESKASVEEFLKSLE